MNEHNVGFCDKCGVRLPKVVPIKDSKNKISGKSERTTLLTIVLVINYLFIALLTLSSIFIFIVGLLAIVGNPSEGYSPLILIILTLIPLVVAVLSYWMTYSLQKYNNTARIVMIVYFIIDLLLSAYIGAYIGIILSLFIIYVLALDKNTVQLYTDQ